VNSAWIRIDFPGTKQLPALLGLTTTSLVLDKIEPGTHLLGFTVVDANEMPLGEREEISFDIVLPDSELVKNRLSLDHLERKSHVNLALNSKIHHNMKEQIQLVFVGSCKMDGQKTIWLEQFARLDRNRYDMCFVSFMQEPLEDQLSSTLASRLRALDIPLILEPIPTISFQEAAQTPTNGGALKYDGQQATLDAYLLERLTLAQENPNNCEPQFVRRTWLHLVNVFARLRADIVVFANARESSDALLTRAASIGRPSAKIVMELPNLFPHPHALDAVDVLVAPSHYAATHESIIFAIGNREIPVIVVNPGVDVKVFNSSATASASGGCHPHCQFRQAASKPCACDTVGFLARVAPEKSPGLLLHAAASVLEQRPFTRFVIVGHGDALPALAELAHAYGIQGAVHFAGAVYGAQSVAERYAAFDLIVNPSLRAWSETLCIANLEAMSLGLPVVSYGVGGIGEYLRHEQNGILINSTNPLILATAILNLLQDSEKRQRLGSTARQTVLDNFLVENQIRKYDLLYSSLHRRRPIPFFSYSGETTTIM